MSIQKRNKIKSLLMEFPNGVVLLSSQLKKLGYSASLIQRCRSSGWLEPIGLGANKKFGDKVDYFGGLYALQNELGLSTHIGGRTALSQLGKGHYLELHRKSLVLFSSSEDKSLPSWFIDFPWGVELIHHRTGFLPPKLGMVKHQVKEFEVEVSGETRAFLECLFLLPKNQDAMECYELMEGMNALPPKLVQSLLESCSSIKVKRLFLFLAEHMEHAWFNYLDLRKIDLGSGARSVFKDGVFNAKYQITIPKSWVKDGAI